MIRVIFLCDEAGAWKVNFFYIFLVLVTVLYQIALKIISSQTNLLAASLMSHSLDFLTATVSPHYHVTASLHHSWVTHLTSSLPLCHHITMSLHHCITLESLLSHTWVTHLTSPLPLHHHITTSLVSHSFDFPTTTTSLHHHITMYCITSVWYDFPHCMTASPLPYPLPPHHSHHVTTSSQYGMIFPTISPHHCVTSSSQYHLFSPPHHCVTTLPCHNISTSPHHLNMVWFSTPH